MFADPFYGTPWAQTSRRGWTTLVSFVAQAAGLGVLLLLPILYGEGIPALRFASSLTAPIPAIATEVPHVRSQVGDSARSQFHDAQISSPHIDTSHVPLLPYGRPAEAVDFSDTTDVGLGARGRRDGIYCSVGVGDPIGPPAQPIQAKPRISRMMEGNLIHRVEPNYPMVAKAARIQGAVILRALISKEGTIDNLTVVSGPPALIKAALEAVSQWRYRPYLLNGEPFEVETRITVNFVLN